MDVLNKRLSGAVLLDCEMQSASSIQLQTIIHKLRLSGMAFLSILQPECAESCYCVAGKGGG